jgi:hypothetical protein
VSVDAGDNTNGPADLVAGNGLPLWIGNINETSYPYDMSDLFMWYGKDIDFSDSANRAKFIDTHGKPVDPSVAVAAFGTPTVLLSGDSSGFIANKGTGGAFTLTGTLTNAATSPSN